jgi:MurNAc alpha-1-phosphate uridylyltransferase
VTAATLRAIVLAAGRGERLRPLTDTLPKPLAPVGGQPLITYHLRALARAGVREVVINLSWLGTRIREALGDGAHFGLRISYSVVGPVALETGGGIFNALPFLGPGPFLVVNGDVWTDVDLGSLKIRQDADASLVLVPTPAYKACDDFGLDGDRVVPVQAGSAPGAAGAAGAAVAAVAAVAAKGFTYSGIGLFRPALFAGCSAGKFPLLPLLNRAITARRLQGTLHTGDWCDVGTPERLVELNERVRSRG